MRFAGPHFFVAADDVDGDRAVLRGDEARHLTTVLRARAGDAVSLADGQGGLYQAQVAAVADDVMLHVTARATVTPPRPALTVVHALPKGRKLDDVVQRLTELGVDRLVPVHSARSQVHLTGDKAGKAVTRWRAVALAAAKQSRRAFLPEVAAVGEWSAAFTGTAGGAVLWEEATVGLGSVVDPHADELVLAVGPEGGLTADEVAETRLPAAWLGPTILRTETAALVAAAVVLAGAGRLG